MRERTMGNENVDLSQESTERNNLLEASADSIEQEASLQEIGIRLWNVNSKRRRGVGRRALFRSASSLEELSSKLQENLILQVEELLDRLYSYLSSIPESSEELDDSPGRQPSRCKGLSLPAIAIGLISSLLRDNGAQEPNEPPELSGIAASLSTVTIQRISLLQFHLQRVRHLRITADPWPKIRRAHSEPSSRRHRQIDHTVFLKDYDRMINRPVVDLGILPSLRILLLDQTPPEWICNLSALRDSLQVLRVERSCIHKISSFLGPTNPLERFPVLPLEEHVSDFCYSKLTHVRFSNCSIGETSDLKGERLMDGGQCEPPLSWCRHTLSLSLAHNELKTEATALAGVSRMSRLDKLDLSYNFLTTLKYAHYRLGSVKVLILSHNQIKSVNGIDRLFALQTLQLDHNALSDLTSVSSLARLPDLNELSLTGNPFQVAHPKRYRVSVLDLFRERRFKQLPDRATFLDMQLMLPTLDGTAATIKELKALRNRTFRPLNGIPAVITVQNDGVLEVPARPRRRRIAAIDACEIKKHRRPQVVENGTPTSSFTVVDVLLSLCGPEFNSPKSAIEEGSDLENEVSSRDDESEVPFLGDVVEPIDRHDLSLQPSKLIFENIEFKSSAPVPTSFTATVPKDRIEEISQELLDEVPVTQSGERVDASEEAVGPTLSAAKLGEEVTHSLKASGTTSATAADTESHPDEVPENLEKGAVWRQEVPMDTTIDDDRASDIPETPSILSPNHMFLSVNPENVWRDDSSVPSSIATPLRDDTSLHMRLLQAEANSIFDGPELYKRLLVHENLELYFRLFVFAPSDLSSHPSSADTSFGTDKQSDIAFMPRIQLWPVDIRKRDAPGLDVPQVPNEQLRRLWKERVVACGKPALRRLTPNRGARYGFHGELLWSEANSSRLKPDTLAENRDVILCCSNCAFYIIADHDTVSGKLMEQKRRFPLPIPKDAIFADAKWPHAMARHPFENLKRIVIGFGFQRLTLCFSESTFSASEFTYILLVACKEETVSLLKELQELVNEAREGPGIVISSEAQIAIENDDRHVLDSMGIAVAPDIVGAVIHYQLLHQRWKHGDRGLVRRVCLVTDAKVFLLDEDFAGDGSVSTDVNSMHVGESTYRLVDAADLSQIAKVQAADADPNAITIMISPKSRLQRPHNWRLVCRNRQGAERLVDDVRKAITLSG